MSDENYILEFLSGKYEGGEFPLSEDEDILIGRSSDLDMVLVEDMVSRKHARIALNDGTVEIEDFGSTNGTFVNGEQISKKSLKVGDRILIGTNIMKLVSREESDADAGVPPKSKEETEPPGGPSTRRTGGATLTGSISGLIEEVPLPDLFQLFESSKKSGVLVVQTEEDRGEIFLRDGRVYYAMINDKEDLEPEKAFHRILAWKTGQFSLEKSVGEVFEDEIDRSLEDLIKEGRAQIEKFESLGDDVPEYHQRIEIPKPLVPPLRSLSGELIDTFQLVYNFEKVSKILDKSLKSDYETMEDLVQLRRKDYLEVIE